MRVESYTLCFRPDPGKTTTVDGPLPQSESKMSEALVAKIQEALSKVAYPGFQRDIVSFGLVKDVRVEGGVAHVRLVVRTKESQVLEALDKGVREALGPIEAVDPAAVAGLAHRGRHRRPVPDG